MRLLRLSAVTLGLSSGFQSSSRKVISTRIASMSTTLFDPSSFYSTVQPAETAPYKMQQTMIRVKNPEVSLKFYIETLGFKMVMHRDFPQWGFSVYFVAHGVNDIPSNEDERWAFCMNTPGCIELTWNHGSEEAEGRLYNVGNSDTTGVPNNEKVKGGFGHLGITVPDVYEACERFKHLGVEFHKSPNGGGMKGLAFVKDPDGYLIEVLPQGPMVTKPIDCCGIEVAGGEGYKDNSK